LLGSSRAALAVPSTTAKERAAVASQSVARQGLSGHDAERKSLVDARQPFAKQSVASRSKAHQKLASQAVAGQRAERKDIAKHSAAQQRSNHPMSSRSAKT